MCTYIMIDDELMTDVLKLTGIKSPVAMGLTTNRLSSFSEAMVVLPLK